MLRSLVGSEMCIRDSPEPDGEPVLNEARWRRAGGTDQTGDQSDGKRGQQQKSHVVGILPGKYSGVSP